MRFFEISSYLESEEIVMLTTNLAQKMCMVGFCLSILASPLAIANNSIELNKDRSAGHGVIAKPESHATQEAALFTKNDLLYDKGDRKTDQQFMVDKNETIMKVNFSPADLVGQGNGSARS